jgi:hypothetical protein
MKKCFITSLVWAAASLAHAQADPVTSAPEAPPINAAYTSAFEGYVPWNDTAIAPWATSNATVDARGGWRAYAKEAADARRRERALKATEAQK